MYKGKGILLTGTALLAWSTVSICLQSGTGSGNLPTCSAVLVIGMSSDKHYYQGGYDYQFVEPLDPKYECPICLLCQRDPYQTTCGHRY